MAMLASFSNQLNELIFRLTQERYDGEQSSTDSPL